MTAVLTRRNKREIPHDEEPITLRHRIRQAGVHAIIAAAEKLDAVAGDRAKLAKALDWQRQAWGYYDLVGELWYASNFVGSVLSRVRLTVAIRNDDGSISPAFGDEIIDPATNEPTGEYETFHPLAQEAAERVKELRSQRGGQAAILRALGLNLTVAGEATILGVNDPDGEADFDVLSVEELVEESGKRYRVDPTKPQDKNEIPGEATFVRIWRPHPRFSRRADAATKPLLEVLEELVLLTRAVRATTTSRLTGAGMLIVDDALDYSDDDDAPEDADKSDKFTADLLEHTTTPITDRGSAAAVVPFVVRAERPPGGTVKDLFHHIDFTRNFDAYPSVELRKEAVRRFAQGIDLPVEIVTGSGAANHWSAWQIDEATYKSHIEPLLTLIVDGLTAGYLHPALRAADGNRKAQDVRQIVAWYDASELLVHPNRGADAIALFDRKLVAGRVVRDAHGYSEDDAPDDDEIAARDAAPLPTDVGVGGVPVGAPPADPGQGANEVAPGPPPAATAALLDRIAAAAEVSVERAAAACGSMIRSKAGNNPTVRSVLSSTHNLADVAMTLGPEECRRYLPDAVFGQAEFGPFARMVRRWAAEAGYSPGYTAEQATKVVETLAARRLTGLVEITAADFEAALVQSPVDA